MTFAEKLRQTMKEKRVTVWELALESGVPSTRISLLRAGARPRPEELTAFAKAMGVSATSLEADEPKPVVNSVPFRERLRQLMKERGLTAAMAAAKSGGVSAQTLVNVMSEGWVGLPRITGIVKLAM